MGFIARVLSIFKVEKVVIYLDKTTDLDERGLISKLFNYILCPQYLRRKVFPLDPDLRYVGLMPPLNTPNHPLERRINEIPKISYREGLVIGQKGQNRYIVDVGLERPVIVHKRKALQHGERVFLKLIKKNDDIEARLIEKKDIPYYFGFDIAVTDMSLKEVIASFKNKMLIVATSKYGKEIQEEVENLMRKMKSYDNKVLLLFGSPFKGLYEIANVEGFNLDEEVDFTLNFIPEQGTKTVRIEEALCSVLAILNFLYRVYSEAG
ncbi:MAG: hypothetical protein DRJ60_04455 [Thermoprotei archaeon]|nr:MAG: hypothetical protein DRJ60_04455 [Thermoprotei archaeon]